MKKRRIREWEARANEHQRNERRRKRRQNFRANYARYEAEAKARNIRHAAEQLLREKLARRQSSAACPVRRLPRSGPRRCLGRELPATGGASKKAPAPQLPAS